MPEPAPAPPPAKAPPAARPRRSAERFQDEETPGFLRRTPARRAKAEPKPEADEPAPDKPTD
jgi:hypothetical protein